MTIGSLINKETRTTQNIKSVKEMTILGIKINCDASNVTDTNILAKIPTIKRDIHQWNRRGLTPIGKICILKTLLISKLVHIFTALPNPSEQCLKDLEKLCFEFVWGSKVDKVKRTKLIQKYYKDGLNMIDLKCFIKSLKISWLKRLLRSNADWNTSNLNELPEIHQFLMYGHKKLRLLQTNTTNPFYSDLIGAWAEYNEQYRPSIEQIISENIWFSNWTKFDMSIIKKWNHKGLRFISDLYNPKTGTIYSRHNLEQIYGIRVNFLCYAALIRSLPKDIQKQVNKSLITNPIIPNKISQITTDKKFSRTAYAIFVEQKRSNNDTSNARLRSKWTADIGDFVEGSLQMLMNATTFTYIIYFHFKIIHRIYASNSLLYKIRIAENNLCTFCEQQRETIYHLFWQCPKTQIFIKEILSHIKDTYLINININKVQWFFLTDLSSIEMLIVTLIKIHIHKSRLKLIIPSIRICIEQIKTEMNKEYIIAKTNNKLEHFERKWKNLKQLLT